MKKIILGIIMAIGGVMLMSQNTHAEWVQQSNVNINSRTYKICQGNSCTTTTENNFGTKTIPFNLLGYTNGYNKYLLEIVADKAINDTSSDRYKSIMVDITIKQQRNSDQQTTIMHIYPEEMGFTLTTNRGDKYGGCILNERGYDYVQYRCGADAPENSTLQHWYMRIGDKSLNGENFAYIGSIASAYLAPTNNINPIVLTYSSVNITNTSDPAVSLLQQQINQNQTIINQNSQIINGIEDINDTLTNSNVNGNFNLSAIQPFGPIATITNNILSLPLILVGVGTCTDVVAPLPYINENLIIECPHKWLPQMAGQFYNVADGIFSAGLYFILARYIFKKVQNLRDPNNDDEEYLDI